MYKNIKNVAQVFKFIIFLSFELTTHQFQDQQEIEAKREIKKSLIVCPKSEPNYHTDVLIHVNVINSHQKPITRFL